MATGCGKDANRKSHKADFPGSLGNPANPAGFPLSHSPDCCWLTLEPDISCATKTGHSNLLRTPTNPIMTNDHARILSPKTIPDSLRESDCLNTWATLCRRVITSARLYAISRPASSLLLPRYLLGP